MLSRSMSRRFARKLRHVVFGGSLLTLGVLSSCDPEVAGIVLEGLQGLSEALISAFFTSITPEDAGTGGSGSTTQQILSIWELARA